MKSLFKTVFKRKNAIAKIAVTFLIASTILACNSSNDPVPITEKPTISVKSINQSVIEAEVCESIQNNVIKINAGTDLVFELNFKAKNELSQYKIDIHENTDCHDHGERPLSEFHYSNISPLSGKEMAQTVTISIPADADKTNYHLEIQAVDVTGMESDHTEYHLIIE